MKLKRLMKIYIKVLKELNAETRRELEKGKCEWLDGFYNGVLAAREGTIRTLEKEL